MVVRTVQEDIFNTDVAHIAFAVNMEGYNDSGFAGLVSNKYWSELSDCGKHDLCTVMSKKVGDKTFHALVCHSLENGWGDEQAEIIRCCFDNIPANGEEIATIAIGTGFVGMLSGADFRQIVCGMHDSRQKIVLHSGYSLDAIEKCYKEEKSKIRVKKR